MLQVPAADVKHTLRLDPQPAHVNVETASASPVVSTALGAGSQLFDGRECGGSPPEPTTRMRPRAGRPWCSAKLAGQSRPRCPRRARSRSWAVDNPRLTAAASPNLTANTAVPPARRASARTRKPAWDPSSHPAIRWHPAKRYGSRTKGRADSHSAVVTSSASDVSQSRAARCTLRRRPMRFREVAGLDHGADHL